MAIFVPLRILAVWICLWIRVNVWFDYARYYAWLFTVNCLSFRLKQQKRIYFPSFTRLPLCTNCWRNKRSKRIVQQLVCTLYTKRSFGWWYRNNESNTNKLSVISQTGSKEGSVCADFTPTLWIQRGWGGYCIHKLYPYPVKIEKIFLIDPRSTKARIINPTIELCIN